MHLYRVLSSIVTLYNSKELLPPTSNLSSGITVFLFGSFVTASASHSFLNGSFSFSQIIKENSEACSITGSSCCACKRTVDPLLCFMEECCPVSCRVSKKRNKIKLGIIERSKNNQEKKMAPNRIRTSLVSP